MSFKKLAVLALPFVIASCGSDKDGSRSSNPFGSKISSQFVDAPVKGMHVEGSISKKMLTGDNGKFSCVNGEQLIFRLVNVEIGRTNCNSWIHLFDLNTSAPDALNHELSASLIQSFATGSSVLDLSAYNKLPEAKTYVSTHFSDGAAIQTAYDNIKSKLPGTNYVDPATAKKNAESNLKDLSKDPVFDKLVTLTEGDLPTGNGKAIHLKAASTNSDDCFENVQVMLKVEPTDIENGKKAYQLKVTEYKAYDGADVPEDCEESFDYDCSENPLWKYITGRTISGSEYQQMSFSYKAGANIACYDGEDYYVTEDTVEGNCKLGDTPIKASKAQSFTFDFGMNYTIAISDKSVKLEYYERNSEFEPVIENANNPETALVHLKAKAASSCRYSATVALD